MRRLLAEHGVAQPAFAAVRTLHEGWTAIETVGLPAVLRPATGGARRLVLLESEADLERYLHAVLADSPTQEAIIEQTVGGLATVAVARVVGEHVAPLALLEAMAPPDPGWLHPTTLFGDPLADVEEAAARAVRALGVPDGIATVELVGARVVDVSAGPPRPEVSTLVREAVGVEVVSDGSTVPTLRRPVALSLLTAEPGPLPVGRVRRVGSLEKVLAFPGVVEARVDLTVGDTIEPLRLGGEPHGYIVAVGETNLAAGERARAAARLFDVDVW
jgi:L-amino acid ligase C-terminal domain 2